MFRLGRLLRAVDIHRDGFAPFSGTVEIRTATPTDFTAKLAIAASSSSVQVNETDTLIDPYRTGTAEIADLHLPILPGTDGALVCAVMHVLFKEGYADRDYMRRYTDDPGGILSIKS